MIESAKRLEQVQTYYFAKKLKEIAELNTQGKEVINLGIGSPDLTPPKEVSQALIDGLDTEKAHQYQSYYGLAELRGAFAGLYNKFFNVQAEADSEILPLIGSKEGIMHIAMSFLNEGDEVLVPNPGYPAYKMTTLLAGGKVRYFDLEEANNWLPNLKKLESSDLSKVKLMWVNYPNMPTGAKATIHFFEQLVAFGLRNNILICHDNPYAFILNDKPISILEIPGAKETALELFSLSKGFNMAGWRVGAVISHHNYIDAIIKFKSNMDSGMFKPVQLAATKALGLEQSWFDSLNEIYTQRRIQAWKIFDLLDIAYKKEAAGLFVWGKVPRENARYWSDLILDKAGVFITPGFIFGNKGAQYLRISLCSTTEIFDQALDRINQI